MESGWRDPEKCQKTKKCTGQSKSPASTFHPRTAGLPAYILDSRLHGNDKSHYVQAPPACVPAMPAGAFYIKKKQTTGCNPLH